MGYTLRPLRFEFFRDFALYWNAFTVTISKDVMASNRLVIPRARTRLSRISRLIRATWRYTSALYQEFNVPIVGFVIATVGGGILYGELFSIARGERIPFIDLPYMMISLMTLQGIPEVALPAEPQLVLFWYIMPIVGIFLIGRGASDFIRLFFNVDEDRSAWEEAVASTYRHHVIVIGVGGHVGMRITRQLVSLNYEVVGVDVNIRPDREEAVQRLNVPFILGDGRDRATMEAAGIMHADALVVCTSNDQINYDVAMRARVLRSDLRIIVRQWDMAFKDYLIDVLRVDQVFSVSDIAAPVFAGAAAGVEIAPSLRVGQDEFSMVKIEVQQGTFLDGHTVEDLQKRHKMDIVLHERDNKVQVQPPGHVIVQAGDTVIVFARYAQVIDMSANSRRPR